jgi:hypothetical protein
MPAFIAKAVQALAEGFEARISGRQAVEKPKQRWSQDCRRAPTHRTAGVVTRTRAPAVARIMLRTPKLSFSMAARISAFEW